MNEQDDEQTSEGLNQIFEIINAKGDIGEIQEILDRNHQNTKQKTEEK